MKRTCLSLLLAAPTLAACLSPEARPAPQPPTPISAQPDPQPQSPQALCDSAAMAAAMAPTTPPSGAPSPASTSVTQPPDTPMIRSAHMTPQDPSCCLSDAAKLESAHPPFEGLLAATHVCTFASQAT